MHFRPFSFLQHHAFPHPRPRFQERATCPSVPQAVGNDPAILLQLGDYGLVERDILLGGAMVAGMDPKFLGQFLARGEAGI